MKRYLILAAFMVALLVIIGLQSWRLQKMRSENERYRANTVTLLSDAELYKVRDSLNAARVQSLELTVQEYERFRAEDAELIRSLKARNRDLAAVNKTQSETIIDLQAIPHDTVIVVRDSIPIPAVAVHCGDAWFDFDGFLTEEQFTGTLANRDSLLMAETVKYKRFLGFLWKTRRVQDRQIDVVSRNPHTTILGLEYVIIDD